VIEAISSHPTSCYLGRETDTHLSTNSFQVATERDKVSPQPPFLQIEHYVIWYRISLWSFWVSCPRSAPSQLLVSPPNCLCMPCLLAGWGPSWKKEVLMLCSHCSAITKTLVCYQQCLSPKSKTQQHTGCYLPQPDPVPPPCLHASFLQFYFLPVLISK